MIHELKTMIKTLVKARKQQKRTQKEIADHLGVTQTTMSRYEHEHRDIPFSLLIDYVEYLGYKLRLYIKLDDENKNL